MTKDRAQTVLLTAAAVVAFAANSVLTRMALAGGAIEASQFVAVRLISGSCLLTAIALPRLSDVLPRRADLGGVVSLLTYVIAFTFAYNKLGAATGALILFPVVQLTLLVAALWRGATLSRRERSGALVALAGVVCLLGPRAAVPALSAGLLMCLAGVGWASYTLLGKGVVDPVTRTARNFIGAAPVGLLIAATSCCVRPRAHALELAILSGAITSGLGYVVWYTVIPRLTTSEAGSAQLLVPVVTALTAVAWLGEPLTVSLVASSILILGGVWLVMSSSRTSGQP